MFPSSHYLGPIYSHSRAAPIDAEAIAAVKRVQQMQELASTSFLLSIQSTRFQDIPELRKPKPRQRSVIPPVSSALSLSNYPASPSTSVSSPLSTQPLVSSLPYQSLSIDPTLKPIRSLT